MGPIDSVYVYSMHRTFGYFFLGHLLFFLSTLFVLHSTTVSTDK